MTLLSLSLNAQKLPTKKAIPSFNATGQASLVTPNTQLRMPSLAWYQFLLGPYTTDDFDTNGIGYSQYYNQGQEITTVVDLTREEWESHLGDTIIGFRFALAGSQPVKVYDFVAYPGNDEQWDQDEYLHVWKLQDLGANGSGSNPATLNTDEVTFVPYASTSTTTTMSHDGVTIASTNANFTGYAQLRIYSGSTTTISTVPGNKIIKIVFNGQSTSYLVSNLSTTTGSWSVSNNVGTWTGNSQSVAFSASAQARCSSIVVTVEGFGDNEITEVLIDKWEYADGSTLPTGWDASASISLYGALDNSAYLAYYDGATISISPQFLQGTQYAKVVIEAGKEDSSTHTISVNGINSSPALTESLEEYTWNYVDATDGITIEVSDYYVNFSSIKVYGIFIVTPEYMELAGGQWYDFFLDDPVVFEVSDNSMTTLSIGYTYYQENSSNFKPTAVNSNSTGHMHESLMYAYDGSGYERGWWYDGESGPGNDDRPGDLAVQLIFNKKLEKTPTPHITYETNEDSYTIIATGDGTVTLTVENETVTGQGSASITVYRHTTNYVVHATATALDEGKSISDPTSSTIVIVATNDLTWRPMTGTYTDGDDPVSFLDELSNGQLIMFIDQFSASTFDNEHPDHYDYTVVDPTLEKTSNTVTIPVYKTSSRLNGLYTKDEVDDDEIGTDLELTPNAVNGTMVYDIKTGNDVYYYGLYRSYLNEDYPEIEQDYRISLLQQSNNQSGIQFFNETMSNPVTPKYGEISDSVVKRVDKDYVVCDFEETVAYVPVIWTWGQNTGRTDGINNSYGSDIKPIELGMVYAVIEGFRSNYDETLNPSHYGEWNDTGGNGTYCVYAPVISLWGTVPETIMRANDGDMYEYEPYMYRVWCTYPAARSFRVTSQGYLVDDGPLTAPFRVDSKWTTEDETVIGRKLEHGEDRDDCPWAFGVPVDEDPRNVEFIIRFYYKKKVSEPGLQPGGSKGNRDEGEEDEGEMFYVVDTRGNGQGIVTGIESVFSTSEVLSRTYVNAQGMQSDKPFEGLNIVITRYSDGTTSTTKYVR